MEDSKITAADDILEISGETFRASPFTDKDLDYLTNYVRYQINKRAREQAEFATSDAESMALQEVAFKEANSVSWYESTALQILSTPEGTAFTAYQMLRKHNPNLNKEWLSKQFGSTGKMPAQALENTVVIREMFLRLNSLSTEVSTPVEQKKAKKKKSPPKQNSTES